MTIVRDENGGFIFEDVEPQLVQLFLAIPRSTRPEDNPQVLDRLYPRPTETSEPELHEEWEQFVVPDLRETFEEATTVVEGDLKPLHGGASGWVIPREHMDAWLNALNQARLALAAKYAVTEEDMEVSAPYPVEDERGLAVAQIHVYGLLQECLIRYIEE
ncbi:MAG: DUF2017 family protein [Chthoniobacteraceae bacterium]